MVAERQAVLAEIEQSQNQSPPFDLERVVLGVRDGSAPSELPPVRIFLGTETAQQRAERIFVWSIEQVRDPSRVYEITLMKELPGFDPRRWLTGFTNYRFAIPELAGRSGRAIYNDVDQIYLTDPAALFDTADGRARLYVHLRPRHLGDADRLRAHGDGVAADGGAPGAAQATRGAGASDRRPVGPPRPRLECPGRRISARPARI